MRIWFNLLATLCPTLLIAQSESPSVVHDAMRVRLPFCLDEPTVTEDSISFYPRVRLFVGYCSTEYGAPQRAVVALDSEDVFYLLDSPESFQLLEQRVGRPRLDSANLVAYAVLAAKLAGIVSWDAVLQRSTTPDPNPSDLAPTFPTNGTCAPIKEPWFRLDSATWAVSFHAATPWWLGRIRVERFGRRVLFSSQTVCQAQHNP